MQSIKQGLLAIITASSLLISAPTMASTIGVINIQKIMQESKAAKSVRSQLESKQKSFQKDLDAKQKQLLGEDKQLVEQRNKISKDAFEKKVKEFQTKAAEAQRAIQTKKAALDKGFAAALNTIQQKIASIAASIAKEKSLELIVAASQLVYADNKLDITEEALKQLDKDLPSVTVNVK